VAILPAICPPAELTPGHRLPYVTRGLRAGGEQTACADNATTWPV